MVLICVSLTIKSVELFVFFFHMSMCSKAHIPLVILTLKLENFKILFSHIKTVGNLDIHNSSMMSSGCQNSFLFSAFLLFFFFIGRVFMMNPHFTADDSEVQGGDVTCPQAIQ